LQPVASKKGEYNAFFTTIEVIVKNKMQALDSDKEKNQN